MNFQSRKSTLLDALSKLGLQGAIEAVLDKELENSKAEFFNNLSNIKEVAYTQVFQAILQKFKVLQKESVSDWEDQFIEYHNEMIHLLKLDINIAVMKVRKDFGEEIVKGTFYQDERTLEALMDSTAKHFRLAMESGHNKQKALKEKLHAQLEGVVETLKELTKENPSPNKEFEIETELANFNIKLNNNEECDCDCGCGESTDNIESFEQLLKKMFSK